MTQLKILLQVEAVYWNIAFLAFLAQIDPDLSKTIVCFFIAFSCANKKTVDWHHDWRNQTVIMVHVGFENFAISTVTAQIRI